MMKKIGERQNFFYRSSLVCSSTFANRFPRFLARETVVNGLFLDAFNAFPKKKVHKNMTESEKFLQIKKEAKFTAAILVALILFWLFAGFGIQSFTDAKIFGLPLWAIMSTVGVWFAAIAMVKLLTTFVFKDMELAVSSEEGGEK